MEEKKKKKEANPLTPEEEAQFNHWYRIALVLLVVSSLGIVEILLRPILFPPPVLPPVVRAIIEWQGDDYIYTVAETQVDKKWSGFSHIGYEFDGFTKPQPFGWTGGLTGVYEHQFFFKAPGRYDFIVPTTLQTWAGERQSFEVRYIVEVIDNKE